MVAENDGMARGVVAALKAQGMAGQVPVSGQDGDLAAHQPRRARHADRVDLEGRRVLGKAAAEAAIAIADGKKITDLPGVIKFNKGKKGVEMNSILLPPDPITKDNLGDVIDTGWISKDKACAGVEAGSRQGLLNSKRPAPVAKPARDLHDRPRGSARAARFAFMRLAWRLGSARDDRTNGGRGA